VGEFESDGDGDGSSPWRGRALDDAFEYAAAGLAIGDRDGRLVRVNRALCDFLGRARDELVGHDIREFTHPDDLRRTEEARAPGRPVRYEKRYLRPDGSVVFGLAGSTTFTTADGTLSHGVGSVVDITAMKQAEEALARRVAQQRSMFVLGQRALDGLAVDQVIDLALRTIVEELAVDGARFAAIADPGAEPERARTVGDDAAPEIARTVVLLDGEPWAVLTAHASADGRLEEEAEPFLRRVAYVVGSARSREHHAMVAERAREQDRLAVAGQLAAGLAHDFNNVLTVVKLHAEILRREDSLTDAGRRQATVISQQTDRAISLVWQLLDVARRGELHCETLDLARFVDEVLPVLRETLPPEILVETASAPAPALVLADVGRLHQVVLNLVANARDAMPQGGRLLLTVRRSEPGDAAGAVAGVRDPGEGMRAGVAARACEPFFSTKGPGSGTGLGLAQVRAIVDQHQGRLGIESAPGDGTSISIWLPSPAEEHGPVVPTNARPSRRTRGRGEQILVVESDHAVAGAVASQLQDLGYAVAVAAGGLDALAVLDQLERIDLVLADVDMPDLGGVDLAHQLAARRPGLSVILTGVRKPRIGAVAVGWLPKPYSPERLARIVADALARR
jgi:hypothetical protein